MKRVGPVMPAPAGRMKFIGPGTPKKQPKPAAPKQVKIGDARNPHDGKALDQQGDVASWQHGHYDYAGNKGRGGV